MILIQNVTKEDAQLSPVLAQSIRNTNSGRNAYCTAAKDPSTTQSISLRPPNTDTDRHTLVHQSGQSHN